MIHDDHTDSSRTDASRTSSRRRFLRTVGAGAVALGSIGAVPGAGAQESGWGTGNPDTDVGTLPPEVTDYELRSGNALLDPPTFGGAVGDGGPRIAFEDGDVVLEGWMYYGRSCEIDVTRVERPRDAPGHVGVTVEPTPTESGSGDCRTVGEWEKYRLRLVGSGEPAIERCHAVEKASDRRYSFVFEDVGDAVDFPDGVSGNRLWIDRDPNASGMGDQVEQAPGAQVGTGVGGTVLAIVGAVELGPCETVGLERVAWADATSRTDLEVDVAAVDRDGASGECTESGNRVFYDLRLPVETVPERVLVTERDAYAAEPERSETIELDGGHVPDLPPGVTDYSVDWESGRSDEAGLPRAEAEVSERGRIVEVRGNVPDGDCERIDLTGLSWADDARTQLQVDFGIVEETDGCLGTWDRYESAHYDLVLDVESVPESVTVGGRDPVTLQPAEDGVDLPPGVLACDLSDEAPRGFVTPPGPLEADVANVDGGTLLTFDRARWMPYCSGHEVVGLEWADDQRTHLHVTLDVASLPSEECLNEDGPRYAEYVGEVLLESAPTRLTVEELSPPDDEPGTWTVDLSTCSRGAAMNGRTVCDPRDVERYQDLTGDGRVSHADVQAFFEVQHRSKWKHQNFVDFNGNDAVGHGDVVALFEDVATKTL